MSFLAQFWFTFDDENMNTFSGFDFSGLFNSFFPEFFNNSVEVSLSKHCKFCGTSLEDIANTGKLGCANCYATFYEELLPFIKKSHGNIKHVGKKPGFNKENNIGKAEDKLGVLKEKLKKAVDAQEFEEAAILRDEINSILKNEENKQ